MKKIVGPSIRQTLTLPEGKTIQLLDPDQLTGEVRARNIVAVDSAGKKLWTVALDEVSQHFYSESVWVSVEVNEVGELWARNFRGFEARLDAHDGQILQKKLYR